MSNGIQVIGSSGQRQIDSSYRNMRILSSGSVPYDDDGDGVCETSLSTTYPGAGLVAVKPTSNDWAGIGWYGKSDGTNIDSVSIACPSGGGGFDYFLAGFGDGPGNDAWGLQVFDGAGDLVFDSGRRYLQVIDVISVSPGSSTTHASQSGAYYITAAITGARGVFITTDTYEFQRPMLQQTANNEVRCEWKSQKAWAEEANYGDTSGPYQIIVCRESN